MDEQDCVSEVKLEPTDEAESQLSVHFENESNDVPSSWSHRHHSFEGSTDEAVEVLKNKSFHKVVDTDIIHVIENDEPLDFRVGGNEEFSGVNSDMTESVENNDDDMDPRRTQVKSELNEKEPSVHSCDMKQESQSEDRDDHLSKSIEDLAYEMNPLLSEEHREESSCIIMKQDDFLLNIPVVDSKKIDSEKLSQNGGIPQRSFSNHSDPKSQETIQREEKLSGCEESAVVGRPTSCSARACDSDVCGKSFPVSSPLLATHGAAQRSKKKPYMCDLCDKTFSKKCHHDVHTRIHTGEKLYICDVCDKAFADKSPFNSHRRLHTGEKPFKCDVCDKTFSWNSSLYAHKRIHAGERLYMCDLCDKAFTEKSSLDAHQRVHTGERPFKCEVCLKAFSSRSSLRAHKRIHTGERPFKCDVCDQTFTRKNCLDRHNKRVHTREKS